MGTLPIDDTWTSGYCEVCGQHIGLLADFVEIDGRGFHPGCVNAPHPASTKRAQMLQRVSHWANSLGWGQR